MNLTYEQRKLLEEECRPRGLWPAELLRVQDGGNATAGHLYEIGKQCSGQLDTAHDDLFRRMTDYFTVALVEELLLASGVRVQPCYRDTAWQVVEWDQEEETWVKLKWPNQKRHALRFDALIAAVKLRPLTEAGVAQ